MSVLSARSALAECYGCGLLRNGASTAKGHLRLDAVDESLGLGCLKSRPFPVKYIEIFLHVFFKNRVKLWLHVQFLRARIAHVTIALSVEKRIDGIRCHTRNYIISCFWSATNILVFFANGTLKSQLESEWREAFHSFS